MSSNGVALSGTRPVRPTKIASLGVRMINFALRGEENSSGVPSQVAFLQDSSAGTEAGVSQRCGPIRTSDIMTRTGRADGRTAIVTRIVRGRRRRS